MLSPDEDGASAKIHNHQYNSNSMNNDDDDDNNNNNNNHQQLRRNNVFNDEDHSNLRTFNLKNQIDQDILVKDEQDDCFDFLNNIAQETSSRHHVFDTVNTNINHNNNHNTHYIITGNTTNHNNNLNHNTQEKQQDWQNFFERQVSQNQQSPINNVLPSPIHHAYVSPFDKRIPAELQPSTVIQMQIQQQSQQMQQGQLEVLTAKWTNDKSHSNTGGHSKQIGGSNDNYKLSNEKYHKNKKWSCSFDNHNNINNEDNVNEILDDINSSKRMNDPVESERKTISELQLQRDYYYLQPGQNGENITFKQDINADPQKIVSISKTSAKLSQKNKGTSINSHLKNSFQFNVYKQVKRWSVKVLSKLSRIRLRSMTPQHMMLIDDWAHAFNLQTLGGSSNSQRQKYHGSSCSSVNHNSKDDIRNNRSYQEQQQLALMNMLLPRAVDSLNVCSASEPLRQLRNSNINSTSLSESGFFLNLQKRTNQQYQQQIQLNQQKYQQNSKSWWQCLKKRKSNTTTQMNKSKYYINSHQINSINTPAQPIQSVSIQSSYQSQLSPPQQIQTNKYTKNQNNNNQKQGVLVKQQQQLSITKNHKQSQQQTVEQDISQSNRHNGNNNINKQDPHHKSRDGSVVSIYWNLARSILCSHGCVLPQDLTRIALDILSTGFLIGIFLIGTLGLVFGQPFELTMVKQQDQSAEITDNQNSSEHPNDLIVVYLLCLILWSIDFFVSCSTGYYYEGKLIASIKEASHRYFFSVSGIFDCFSIFFLFWCLVFPSKIPQMLCLIRIISFYWTQERIKFACSLKITHRIGFRIGLILSIIGLLMHSATIVWIAIGQAEKDNESSWMSKYNLEKEDNHNEIYASALYQMSSTLLFQGSPCFSWREQIFLVWVQIISLVLLAIIANEFLTIKTIYNQRHTQEQKLLDYLLIDKKLPYPKVFELQAYMDYQRSSSSMRISDRDIQTSMNAFPENIQKDLLWSINRQIVWNSTILQPFSSQTKGEIAKISQEQQFTANSVLYYQGEQHDDCLYIVVKGKVELFYVTEKRCSEADNYLVFQTICSGGHFGEYSFFTGMARESYAKCSEDSVLFRINRNSFMRLLQNCSKDKEYFCETRDDLILNDQQSQSTYKTPCITTTYCSVCQQPGHGVISCPSMHYVADKDRLLLVFSHSQFQVRRFVSSKRIRGKSNAWGDLSQIQNCANRIENNSSLYNKCANDAYNNNSSYYHQQQDDTEQQILNNDEQGNGQIQQYQTSNHNNTYNTNYYNNNHSTSNILTQNHPYASSSMNQHNQILSDSEEYDDHDHHDHMTNPNSHYNVRRQTENSNVREEYTTTNRQFMSMDVFNSKHILPSIEREQQSTFKTQQQQQQQQLVDKDLRNADSFYHPSRKDTIVLVNGENALHSAIQGQFQLQQVQQQQQQIQGISPRQQLQVIDGNNAKESPQGGVASTVAGVLRNKKKNLTWNIEEDHIDKDGLSQSSHHHKQQQFYGHNNGQQINSNGMSGAGGTQGNTQHSEFAEASPNHNYNNYYNNGNQNVQSISRLSQTPMTLQMLHNEDSMVECSPNQQQQHQQHSNYLPTQLPTQQSNPQQQSQSQAQTSQGNTEPQRIQTLENINGTPTKEMTFSEQVQYPYSPLAESSASITKLITNNNNSNNNHNNNNNINGIVRHALSQSGSLVFANTLPNLNNNTSNNYNDVLSEIKHQQTWKKTSSKYNTNNNNDSQFKEDTNSIHSASNFKKSIKKKKNLSIIQEQHQSHPKRRVHTNAQQQFSPMNQFSANNTPRSINNNNTPSNYNNNHNSNIPVGFMNINGLVNYPSPTLKANNTSMMLMMNDQEHNMSLNVPMCSSSLSNNNNFNYYLTDQSKRHHTLQEGQNYYVDNNNNNDLLSLTIDPSLLQSYEQQSDLNRMRQSRQSSASRLALQLPKLSQVLPHTAAVVAPFNQLIPGRPPLYNNNINRQYHNNNIAGQNNTYNNNNNTLQQHLRSIGQQQSSPYHQAQHYHTQQQIQQYSPLCLPCNHSALNIFQQHQYNQSPLLGGISQSPILAEGEDVLRKKCMLNKLLRQKSSLPEEGIIHAPGTTPNSNFSIIPTNFLIPSGSCINNSQSYISYLNPFQQPYSNSNNNINNININNNKSNNYNNNASSYLPYQMETLTHRSSDQQNNIMNINLLQNLNILKNNNINNTNMVFGSWQVMEYESMEQFEFYKPHNNSSFILKQLVDNNKIRLNKKKSYSGNAFYVYSRKISNKARRH